MIYTPRFKDPVELLKAVGFVPATGKDRGMVLSAQDYFNLYRKDIIHEWYENHVKELATNIRQVHAEKMHHGFIDLHVDLLHSEDRVRENYAIVFIIQKMIALDTKPTLRERITRYFTTA